MNGETWDVAVIGSGSAGLTAATVAARLGLKTVLIESGMVFGGTSAWSGGNCWAPGNSLMTELGIEDSEHEARDYIRHATGGAARPELVNAFVGAAPAMIDFLLATSEVRFAPLPMPDWTANAPGGKPGGRALAPIEYDGRLLGSALLRKLQRPLGSFNAPFGFMLSYEDAMLFMGAPSSRAAIGRMASLLKRHCLDRLRYGRGSRLTMGGALIGRLLRSAVDAGVTLRTECRAEGLERTGKRVTGITVTSGGDTVALRVKRGVVLATGGRDPRSSTAAASVGQPVSQASLMVTGNVGDGARMAQAVGAALDAEREGQALWVPVSVLGTGEDRQRRCLHFWSDLPKPGFVVVDERGERFANEASPQFAGSMFDAGIERAWLIGDHRAVRKHGVGLVWPHLLNLRRLQKLGYVRSASSLLDLAHRIGIAPVKLEQTIARFNQFARNGEDADFGRGGTEVDRAAGDPTHLPNPCLGSLDIGPFHAVEILLGDLGSAAGLAVNDRACVLDTEGEVIPGLYACGTEMTSIWAGRAMGPGANHAHNMTFAYIAAQDLASAQLDPVAADLIGPEDADVASG